MTRFGPLHAVPPHLVVGDPTRRHLRLSTEGIHYCKGGDEVVTYDWDAVTAVTLSLPTTRFPFPGAVAGVVVSSVALFVQDDPGFEAKDGSVVIATVDGPVELTLHTHHLWGYWVRSAVGAQRIIDRLIADAPSRRLLEHPESLVNSARGAARRR